MENYLLTILSINNVKLIIEKTFYFLSLEQINNFSLQWGTCYKQVYEINDFCQMQSNI